MCICLNLFSFYCKIYDDIRVKAERRQESVQYPYPGDFDPGFAGYAVAMLLSYFVGQKKYPIHYDLKAIGKYVALALVLFGISEYLPFQNIFLLLSVRTVLLMLFVAYIIKVDFPLHQIPVINRFIKK